MEPIRFSTRLLTAVLVLMSILLALFGAYDYHTRQAVRNLQERYWEIERLRSAAAPHERLNTLLQKQMESALAVENSKEYLARISFTTILILLLLSWLVLLRVARSSQEALVASNAQLSRRTRELDELNRTLDRKVQERTARLQQAFEELRKAHADLKNTQAQLLQAEKFSAIGHLAAGVAHEINNPIGFINSNLQTLENYFVHYKQLLGILNKLEKALKDKDRERETEVVTSWEKVREETNFIFIGNDIGNLIKESREGVEKIRKIVLDLRAFAKPDRRMVHSVDLESLMESMLNIAWNEIKYKAQLRKDYAHVPPIICNPQKIGQVFINLLINAAHAIKDKGFITLKTRVEGDFVCVDVMDTGCGISPEHTTNIFDPFFTTKPVGQGAGLGLSISYDIVRKHGGTITFISEPGQGTTFTVKLPVAYACDWAQL